MAVKLIGLDEMQQSGWKSIALLHVPKHGGSWMGLTGPGKFVVALPGRDATYITHPNKHLIHGFVRLRTWDETFEFMDGIEKYKKDGVKTVIIDPIDQLVLRLLEEQVPKKHEGNRKVWMDAYSNNTKHISRLLNMCDDLKINFIASIHLELPTNNPYKDKDEPKDGIGLLVVGEKLRQMMPGYFDLIAVVERRVMGNNLTYWMRTVPKANDEPIGHWYGPDTFKSEERIDKENLTFLKDCVAKMLNAQGYVFPVPKGSDQ